MRGMHKAAIEFVEKTGNIYILYILGIYTYLIILSPIRS